MTKTKEPFQKPRTKEHGPIIESRQTEVGEAQIQASIQCDKLEELREMQSLMSKGSTA